MCTVPRLQSPHLALRSHCIHTNTRTGWSGPCVTATISTEAEIIRCLVQGKSPTPFVQASRAYIAGLSDTRSTFRHVSYQRFWNERGVNGHTDCPMVIQLFCPRKRPEIRHDSVVGRAHKCVIAKDKYLHNNKSVEQNWERQGRRTRHSI